MSDLDKEELEATRNMQNSADSAEKLEPKLIKAINKKCFELGCNR